MPSDLRGHTASDESSNHHEDTVNDSQDQDDAQAYAEQFCEEEQQHWDDSYPEGSDDDPPSRGGWMTKDKGDKVNKPAPKPAPVNNPLQVTGTTEKKAIALIA